MSNSPVSGSVSPGLMDTVLKANPNSTVLGKDALDDARLYIARDGSTRAIKRKGAMHVRLGDANEAALSLLRVYDRFGHDAKVLFYQEDGEFFAVAEKNKPRLWLRQLRSFLNPWRDSAKEAHFVHRELSTTLPELFQDDVGASLQDKMTSGWTSRRWTCRKSAIATQTLAEVACLHLEDELREAADKLDRNWTGTHIPHNPEPKALRALLSLPREVADLRKSLGSTDSDFPPGELEQKLESIKQDFNELQYIYWDAFVTASVEKHLDKKSVEEHLQSTRLACNQPQTDDIESDPIVDAGLATARTEYMCDNWIGDKGDFYTLLKQDAEEIIQDRDELWNAICERFPGQLHGQHAANHQHAAKRKPWIETEAAKLKNSFETLYSRSGGGSKHESLKNIKAAFEDLKNRADKIKKKRKAITRRLQKLAPPTAQVENGPKSAGADGRRLTLDPPWPKPEVDGFLRRLDVAEESMLYIGATAGLDEIRGQCESFEQSVKQVKKTRRKLAAELADFNKQADELVDNQRAQKVVPYDNSGVNHAARELGNRMKLIDAYPTVKAAQAELNRVSDDFIRLKKDAQHICVLTDQINSSLKILSVAPEIQNGMDEPYLTVLMFEVDQLRKRCKKAEELPPHKQVQQLRVIDKEAKAFASLVSGSKPSKWAGEIIRGAVQFKAYFNQNDTVDSLLTHADDVVSPLEQASAGTPSGMAKTIATLEPRRAEADSLYAVLLDQLRHAKKLGGSQQQTVDTLKQSLLERLRLHIQQATKQGGDANVTIGDETLTLDAARKLKQELKNGRVTTSAIGALLAEELGAGVVIVRYQPDTEQVSLTPYATKPDDGEPPFVLAMNGGQFYAIKPTPTNAPNNADISA